MTEGIKHLIECEKKARLQIDDALADRKNALQRAQIDAEERIREYKISQVFKLQKEKDDAELYLANLTEELQKMYYEKAEDIDSINIDEKAEEIISIITGHREI